MRALPFVAFGIACTVSGCRELPTVCTSEGATWEVAPQRIDAPIGQRVRVSITRVTCRGRSREPIYPALSVADTSIAFVNNTQRYVLGRAAGVTVLSLTPDNGDPPAQVPVTITSR